MRIKVSDSAIESLAVNKDDHYAHDRGDVFERVAQLHRANHETEPNNDYAKYCDSAPAISGVYVGLTSVLAEVLDRCGLRHFIAVAGIRATVAKERHDYRAESASSPPVNC